MDTREAVLYIANNYAIESRYTVDMIRSVVHPFTRAHHRSHAARHTRTLWAMGLVIVAVLIAFVTGLFHDVSWGTLLSAVLETTYRLLIAYAVAALLGISIGLLVGWSPMADYLFPLFDILQNIPSFALIPFFIHFFGYSNEMIIAFAVSSIIWPILFAVLTAIKGAHSDLSDAATVFGARGMRRITAYLAPLSFPAILTGSIVGIAIGWEAVIGAELLSRVEGYGSFITQANADGIGSTAVAGILVIILIVFLINRLVWTPLLAESSKHYVE